MRLGSQLVSLMLAFPGLASAQMAVRPTEAGRAAVAGDSVPLTVAAAEAWAAGTHAGMARDSAATQAVRATHVGSGALQCVEVGHEDFVRSGDFVVGFGSYGFEWHQGYGKIAWNPVRGSAGSPPKLVVTATRLNGDPMTRVFNSELNHGALYFYPSGIHLPAPGRWMLVAKAGDTWGCFVYELS